MRDLAVMLADGGDCVSDLAALRDQPDLFGEVASDSTAFRVIDRIAYDSDLIGALRRAHARARVRAWQFGLRPERLTIDLDATLVTSHSEKDGAAGDYKGGYGFQPLLCYADETGEALAGLLRAGNAAANNARDQVECLEAALDQLLAAGCVEEIELLVRTDSAGQSHRLLDFCRERGIGFSVGYELAEPVRDAILELPEDAWRAALRQDDEPRDGAHVAELTGAVCLAGWPAGSRLIVRRERPHPGAQFSFTDHDGHRFQAILTDQQDPDIARIERRHRARANVEDHIRCDKDTGLRNLPFRDFRHNEVWLELVLIAHNLLRLDKTAAALRRAREGRAQTAALPAAAHRRPARLPRKPRQAAPTSDLAVGARARHRVSPPRGAHLRLSRDRRRLTPPTSTPRHTRPPHAQTHPATTPSSRETVRTTPPDAPPPARTPTTHAYNPTPPPTTALLQDPG